MDRLVLRGQAVYYLLTGLWPLVSLSTFEKVTGPKVDDWLVHMVGLLAATIGAALWAGSRAREVAGSTLLLAGLSAASFAAIDLRYALSGRISWIYLTDAVLEVGIIIAIVIVARRRPPSPAQPAAPLPAVTQRNARS